MLNFQLSDSQTALRDEARKFALAEILPVAWYYDEQDSLPRTILDKAFAAGMLGSDIPAAYGGRGLGLVDAALITEEIAAACPGLATSIFDSSLGMEPILLSANEAARQRYLPQVARDGRLIAFATSEPTTGSDVAGIRCTATADGDGYLLSGTKYWITNGGVADYVSVFATVDPKSRHQGICAFVVATDAPGVTIGRPIPKMGQRCSNTVGIHFDKVRVSGEQVLAEPGKGFVLAMKTFARTRPIIGSFGVGAARAAMEYALDYASKRRAFGMAIGEFQGIQFKLAEMFQKVETARLLTWKAAWEADQQQDGRVSASIGKMYASEAALEVVDEALQIFGGYGYTKMMPIEKLLRDVRLLRIYEGTSEVQRLILADYLFKEYPRTLPLLEDLPLIRETDPLGDDMDWSQVWRCRICGHVHHGEHPPELCPYCFFPAKTFKQAGRAA
jgi:acyl-CoA dehydrogenase